MHRLSYPVIIPAACYRGSLKTCWGGASEKSEKHVPGHHVTRRRRPHFLHTFNDQAVPVENSLLIANALRQQGVPFELHIYTEGVHGLSLCDKETAGGYGEAAEWINPHAATWFSLCVEWLNGLWGR